MYVNLQHNLQLNDKIYIHLRTTTKFSGITLFSVFATSVKFQLRLLSVDIFVP